MMRSYHAMVMESCARETPLEKFRQGCSEDEQAALDKVLAAVRRYEVRAAHESHALPSTDLLLLVLAEQNERVERLELLLQNLAGRVAEMYGASKNDATSKNDGASKNDTKPKAQSVKWEAERQREVSVEGIKER